MVLRIKEREKKPSSYQLWTRRSVVNYSRFIEEAMVLMQKPSVIDCPSGRSPERPQDGISWVQKVAAVEKCFRGCSCWFGDIWVYIGERIRSRDARGAHKGGDAPYPPGRALRPCVRLVAPSTSFPSLLVFFWSKKNHREGFITIGLHLVFLFFETLKQGKSRNQHQALV